MPLGQYAKKLAAQERWQQEALPHTIPAPIGGLNLRDPLAALPETDAIQADNCLCQPGWIEPRWGNSLLATFAGVPRTLIPHAPSGQLFAATDVNNSTPVSLFRVDNAGGGSAGVPKVGGAGNTVQALTSAYFDWAEFGTGPVQITIAVNGIDTPLLYDGTQFWSYQPVTATVTGISKAASAVVTINTVSASNPFVNGNTIWFAQVLGMTQINGAVGTVTGTGGSSGAWTITVNINSSGFTAYSSAGVLNPFNLTGGPSSLSNLSQVVRYKSRLWFVAGPNAGVGGFTLYYLPQNVYSGALTALDLGAQFTYGGFLQTCVTVSIDNSAGTQDYIAFCSNQGEVVVFQGYDPSSVSTWFEVAHFMIGRPLGTGMATWVTLGSDALILCADGIVPISAALLTDRTQPGINRADKIRPFVQSTANFQLMNGGYMQLLLYPRGTKMILNVVQGSGGFPFVGGGGYQIVQSTLSQGWSTWNFANGDSWKATAMRIMNDRAFFGAINKVCEFTDGATPLDQGTGFSWGVQGAPSIMGREGEVKEFTAATLIVKCSASESIQAQMGLDLQQPSFQGLTATTVLPGSAAAQNISQNNIACNGSGLYGSLALKFTLTGTNARQQLYAITYLFKPGGTQLYG
jgi:hypothetical protein